MVKQRFDFDCAVACLAMFMDKDWESVYRELGEPKEGLRGDQKAQYLWNNGIDVEWHEGEMPKQEAIITVWSKNFPGRKHSIYFDGHTFHDPSTLQLFESMGEIEDSLVGSFW